jgi:hypothetical protein
MVENIGQGGRVHFSQGVENLWGSAYRQSIGRIDQLFEHNEGLVLQIGDYTLRAEEGEIKIYLNGQLASENIREVLVKVIGEDQAPYCLYHVLGRLRQHDLSGKKVDLAALVSAARETKLPAAQAARRVVTLENLVVQPVPPPAPDPHPLQTYVGNVNANPTLYLDPIGRALSEGATPGRIDDQEAAALRQTVPAEVIDALRDGNIDELERARLGLDPGLYRAYIAGQEPVEQLNGLLAASAIQQALLGFIDNLTAAQIATIDDPNQSIWFEIGGWPVLSSEIRDWRSQSQALEERYASRKNQVSPENPPTIAQNDLP